MSKSVPVAIVIAGLIIGGAEIASAWIQRPQYSLVSWGTGLAARIDVHSGQIDVCEPNPSTMGVSKIAKNTNLQTFGVICFNEQGQPARAPERQ